MLSLNNLKYFYNGYGLQSKYIDYYFNTTAEDYPYRKPIGTEYRTSPWLLFGCSFAYGQFLQDNQCFHYKLSKIIKHPIYNRAMIGTSIQHAYYQTEQDYFYKQVPPCSTVIYLLFDGHYNRMLGENFYIASRDIYLHYNYNYNNHKFVMDDYKNPFILFIKRDYICRSFCYIYNRFLLKHKPDYISEETLDYFINIRKNLELRWGRKVKFIVLFYNDPERHQFDTINHILISKLKSNNFEVINIPAISNVNLYDEKYLTDDGHPNENAWNIITPKLVEEFKKRNIIND